MDEDIKLEPRIAMLRAHSSPGALPVANGFTPHALLGIPKFTRGHPFLLKIYEYTDSYI